MINLQMLISFISEFDIFKHFVILFDFYNQCIFSKYFINNNFFKFIYNFI